MKRAVVPLLFLIAIFTMPLHFPHVSGPTAVFSDGLATINHSSWSIVSAGSGPVVFTANQALEITIPSGSLDDPTAGIFGTGITSVCKLTGDFDIQVDYNLLSWPFSNGVRVGLSSDPNFIFSSNFGSLPPYAIERISLGSPTVDFPGPVREIYGVDFSDRASIATVTPTSDLSGSLRLVRVGATETGYYYSGGWTPVHTGPTTVSDVPISIVAWSHGYAFSGLDVSLSFRNFLVKQGQFVCPPLSDNFDGGIVNSSSWSMVDAGTGPSMAMASYRLEVLFPASSTDDPSTHVMGSGLTSNCLLQGDFDAQVNFNLITWPNSNGVRVALAADPVYIFASNFSSQSPYAIERVSFGTSNDFPAAPREVYLTDLGDRATYSTITPTNSFSGSLRLIRSGNMEIGYYFSPVNGWSVIHTGPATTQNVPLSLVAWTHDYAFTQQTVGVAFDNFILNSGNLVCPTKGISVQSFFTDSHLAPLPSDSRHFTRLDALFAGGNFRQTMPPRVLAWVNVTNTAQTVLGSLRITEALPPNWFPMAMSPTSSQVFLGDLNGTRTPLPTGPYLTITQFNSTISLTIQDMNQIKAATGLNPSESLLLVVPMMYSPSAENQSPSSYPLTLIGISSASAWTGTTFSGKQFTGSSTASVTIYARIQGDLAGNGRVDIVDTGLIVYIFGSKIGEYRWVPSADFDGDGVISLIDVSIVFHNYGLSG